MKQVMILAGIITMAVFLIPQLSFARITNGCGPECYHDGQCYDGDCCTIDQCIDGQCVHQQKDCADEDPCTVDSCVDGECVHQPMNCDDGDLCTIDSCVDGECVNTPIDCDDGDECTIDSCDSCTGECVNEEIEGCGVEEENGEEAMGGGEVAGVKTEELTESGPAMGLIALGSLATAVLASIRRRKVN